ncbi:hypothetical protein RJ55_08294 [Drechmeria coniospora]|nr:hypothetical protein RJ55_08294 [Drechmeria coniospora]
MEDPGSPTIFRVPGPTPFGDPDSPGLPSDIAPRPVTLRDRQTVATIVPLTSRHQLPPSLLVYLCDQLNREIDGGDTYPMMEPFTVDGFADYWFQTFGAVMLLGEIGAIDDVCDGKDWAKECLGSFFIKPNYPGRSSHICNGSFIVTDGSRNRGVGRLMGEAYIDWAPRLGYTYSVFNLVYETNVASCRIWDALGFKRIGRVKACGNLRSHPGRLIDAIIYGRDLDLAGAGVGGSNGDEFVSEERFDKIRYYLKTTKYPAGANRAEKSRLRSAATHYKLLEGDKLMLKDKEVISDPVRQYETARNAHNLHHWGINKTTATIAEKYHWSRIKETVSDVIRACSECKEQGKSLNLSGGRKPTGSSATTPPLTAPAAVPSPAPSPSAAMDALTSHSLEDAVSADERVLALQQNHDILASFSQPQLRPQPSPSAYANPNDISVLPPPHDAALRDAGGEQADPGDFNHHRHHIPMLQDRPPVHDPSAVYQQPVDPAIIDHHHHHHHHHHQPPHHHHHSMHAMNPMHPMHPMHHQMHHDASNPPPHAADTPFDHYNQHAEFQALLNATEDDVVEAVPADEDRDPAAVDRDLDMLIEQAVNDGDDGDAAMDVLDAQQSPWEEDGRRQGAV